MVSAESLGRMVERFNAEKLGPIPEERLEQIRRAAEHGDLSTIMPSYEESIEKPIRNALFGDFIRLVLIQVQKQKGSPPSINCSDGFPSHSREISS